MKKRMITKLTIVALSLMLLGCATNKPNIVYKTQFQEVMVPVVYEIERPKRPKYLIDDTVPGYLIKLKQYILTLEAIIDEYNKKAKKD